MFATELVQFCQQVGRGETFSINGNGIPFFKLDINIFRLIRCIFGSNCEDIHLLRGFCPRVFQHIPFKGDMEQVAVGTPGEFFAGWNWNPMLFSIIFKGGTAVHVPFTPWGNNFDGWVKVVVGNFKPNLVIPFSCRSVGNCIGPFFGGNFHLCFRNQWPGDGSAEEVTTFIDRIGTEHRKDEITGEFLFQIKDMTGYRTGVFSFFGNTVELFSLTKIGAKSDNFTIIFFN